MQDVLCDIITTQIHLIYTHTVLQLSQNVTEWRFRLEFSMAAAGSVRMSSSTSRLRFCVVMENTSQSDQAVRGITNYYTTLHEAAWPGERDDLYSCNLACNNYPWLYIFFTSCKCYSSQIKPEQFSKSVWLSFNLPCLYYSTYET